MSIVTRSSSDRSFVPARPIRGLTHCAAATAIGCLEAKCWASHFSLIARVASSIFMLGSRLAPDHHLPCPWHVRADNIGTQRLLNGGHDVSVYNSLRSGVQLEHWLSIQPKLLSRARAIRVLMRKGLAAEKARGGYRVRLDNLQRVDTATAFPMVVFRKGEAGPSTANGIDPNVSLFEDKPSTALLFGGAVEAFPAICHLIL
jgi:hypothetical protein